MFLVAIAPGSKYTLWLVYMFFRDMRKTSATGKSTSQELSQLMGHWGCKKMLLILLRKLRKPRLGYVAPFLICIVSGVNCRILLYGGSRHLAPLSHWGFFSETNDFWVSGHCQGVVDGSDLREKDPGWCRSLVGIPKKTNESVKALFKRRAIWSFKHFAHIALQRFSFVCVL